MGRPHFTDPLLEQRTSPPLTREAVEALKTVTFGSTPVSSVPTNQASAFFTPPNWAKELITAVS